MNIISAWTRHAPRRSVAFLLALALLGGSFAWPQTTSATTIVSDTFGVGSNSFNDLANILDWNEEGDDDDSITLAKVGGNSGADVRSPGDETNGRFAKIGYDSQNHKGEWICRQVNSSNYYNLTLEYRWNGDSDAENNEDYGVVEYRSTSNGNTDQTCNSDSSGWTQLPGATHELEAEEDWSSVQEIELPALLNNDSSWFIRFRNAAEDNSTGGFRGFHDQPASEYFRVDSVLIGGDYDVPGSPTVTINQADTQADPTGDTPILFTADFNEPVFGFEDGDVIISGTALPTSVDVVGNDGDDIYTIKVSGMSGDGTVVATIPSGVAEDIAGNDNAASSSTDNTVTYNLPNRAPLADPQNVVTDEDTPVNITLSGSDPDGDSITYEVVILPNHGNLTGTEPNLTYTPDDDYFGPDSFKFITDDGALNSVSAEVKITVNPVEDRCPTGYHFNESEVCVPDEVELPGQCIIVSDALTLVDTNDETDSPADPLSFVHSAWDHTLESAATWIWGDNPVQDPTIDETQVFTRTFYLEEAPTSATLVLASDNGYLVKVNGTQMGTDELGTFDPNPPHTFNPTTSIPVTGLIAGANTLEVTVFNKGTPGESNPQNNPAGLIYKLTVNGSDCGEPKDDPVNSCILPEGNDSDPIVFGETPVEEDTLQTILDDAYGVDAPDADLDQDNFEEWAGTGNTVNFTVENISEDSNSGHSHVFGYYLNGGDFTPVFRDGSVGAPYSGAPDLAFANSLAFSVANVNDIVFAIADWDAVEYTYFATDASLNAGSEVHAVSYNVDNNKYAIAFEDLPFSEGDEDYNDVAVALEIVSCEAGATCEPGVELLANGTFEVPEVGSSLWDIFNIDEYPNLAWAAEWLNPIGAPPIANVELQETGLNGWSATGDGDQWTELDSDWNGHKEGPNNEAGQVAISQTIDTVPGETYTLTFDFSPRPQTDAAQNKVEVLANDVVFGTVGPLATAGNQTEWTSHTFSFVADANETTVSFRDAGAPSDSLGTFVDNASLMCEEPEPTATLSATKIICNNESDLPNWGAGGADITATTAADFLETHPGCRLETDWQFQWVTDADDNTNPGDNIVSPAPSPWYLFGQGVGDGSLTTEIPAGGKVWVREVLKEGFIPFTGANTSENISAEIYCSTDVLNYDNWDWIDPVAEGEDYFCVAFNAPTNPGDQCDPNASTVLLSSDADDEETLLTLDESGPASLVGEFIHSSWAPTFDALWIWKDSGTSAEDALNGTDETFTRTFTIVGTPLDSTLELAADNGYEVKVNGTSVCADAGEHNYEATTTCAVPAAVLINGENTITFEIVNIDHETANDPENNPAGLLYKLTVNENECELPPEPFSSVTMCKTDTEGTPLSNWTLTLRGAHVEDLVVPTNSAAGINSSTSLEDGLSYLAYASGIWTNQSGANAVDAEYSTTDGWTTPMDGYTGYQTDILELQIEETFDPNSNWGPYSSAHEYAQSFIKDGDGSANFRIFDGTGTTPNAGWYGDNSGTLAVSLYEGYAGVTGENGCVTFENVPYGAYTAGELLQNGWEHYATWDSETVVDGGAVSVNGETETFTIQNRYIREGNQGSDTGTLTIVKETNGVEGVFTFQVGGNEDFSNVEIATEGGEGSEELTLEPGLYSVTENVPEGWTLESVTCEYEGESEGSEILNGHQIQIYEDEEVTCTFVNHGSSESDGNTSRTSNNDGGGDGDGEVLGATDEASCGPLLSTFLGLGKVNDATEVSELQGFLNDHMSSGLPVTGVFGPMTHSAVQAFQLLYWEEVLQPWFGIEGSAIQDKDDATGYVYKTTQRQVNNIFCPSLNLPMPELP